MKRTLTTDAYERVHTQAKQAGSATFAGEKREKQGLGLDPLVDPSAHGLIRRSISWYEPHDEGFILLRGVAMLVETLLDTTGSMGTNVELAMNALLHTYEMLSKGKNAVLRRYDLQMITAIFGDTRDKYILNRSQAEMDERIAEQMTLMLPEKGGAANGKEDPEYGLFGAAYLTNAMINKYGLKRYHFTISDEPVPDYVEEDDLVRVFGKTVRDKVKENGYEITGELPTTTQVVADLLKTTHAFFMQVDDRDDVTECWTKMYGKKRVVMIHDVSLLPQYQASIIGLTEGTLTLQSLEEFLVNDGKVESEDAKRIKRAVAGIPIGAQMSLENFNKIPNKGDYFAKKGDLWTSAKPEKTEKGKATGRKKGMW